MAAYKSTIYIKQCNPFCSSKKKKNPKDKRNIMVFL